MLMLRGGCFLAALSSLADDALGRQVLSTSGCRWYQIHQQELGKGWRRTQGYPSGLILCGDLIELIIVSALEIWKGYAGYSPLEACG